MVLSTLLVMLIIAVVATPPSWRYSRDWGFIPFATASVLLLIVMAIALSQVSN
jgi:hypothetical protein